MAASLPFPRAILAPLLALLLVAAAGCGKKGPPRAPVRVQPDAVRDLRLRQIGPDVVASFALPAPAETSSSTPLTVGLLRMLATETLQPGAVSDRYLLSQFHKHARVVAEATAAPAGGAQGGRLRLVDAAPPPSGAGLRRRYLYSVLVTDASGKGSPLPLPRGIDVVVAPPAPTDLTIGLAEGEVQLTWSPGAPGGAGFNVYRREGNAPDPPDRPINRAPIAAPGYIDTTFRYGETYRYSVRALALAEPPPRESLASAEREVRPLDVYPPAAPTGVAVSAEGAVIKIYWFPSAEPDLGGYRIYRRDEAHPDPVQIGEAGAAETVFIDTTARPGVRYHYVVTAVDGAAPPNESGPSEERSETIPRREAAPSAAAAPGSEQDPRQGER